MNPSNDKRIASWLQTSQATFYRWLKAGLLPRRPKTQEEAQEMRKKIDLARDRATRMRPNGMSGRTSIDAVISALKEQK